MIQLNILSGKKAGTRTMARHFPFRIGRAADNELQLEDDGVWDRHLTIELNPQSGFSVVTAPEALTTVNGVPVQNTVLRNGDAITAGSVKIQFWLAAARQGSLRLRENFVWFLLALVTFGQFILALLADPLMAEMPRARERHRHAAFIRRRDDFRVLDRPARLDRRRRARVRRRQQPVGKRKKCITANHAARQRKFRLARLPHRDAAGIHAAHLARARAERPAFAGIENRVRFQMFHHAPPKQHCLQFRLPWVAAA